MDDNRIIKIKAMMTDRYPTHPFIVAALDSCNLFIRDMAPYGCVFYANGRFHIGLNHEVFEMNNEGQEFIVMHELYHIFLGHLSNRWLTKLYGEGKIVNMAADIAIHELLPVTELEKKALVAEDYSLPEEKTTEFYLNALKDQTIDSDGFSQEDLILKESCTEEQYGEFIKSVERIAGKMPGDMRRAINAERGIRVEQFINGLHSIVDESGGRGVKKTWSVPNRRNPSFRGKIRRAKSKLFLIVDTSGSIGETELNIMAGGLQSLKEYCKIFVCVMDAAVHETFWFRNSLPKQLSGGGGTVFHEGFELAEKMNFKNMAIFTDGYCDYPPYTSMKNVLWGIINNDNFSPQFGKVINLK